MKLCFLFVVFALTVSSLDANPQLAIDAPTVMLARSRLIIRALVEPDPANRVIQITAESAGFYRSSEVQLDGSAAPRSTIFEYPDLPAGTYEIHTVLMGEGREPRATVERQLDVRTGRS
jgi:hypothetical protein